MISSFSIVKDFVLIRQIIFEEYKILIHSENFFLIFSLVKQKQILTIPMLYCFTLRSLKMENDEIKTLKIQ